MIYIHLAYEKSTLTKANAPRLPVAHGLKLVVQLKVESDLFRPVGVGHCIVTNKWHVSPRFNASMNLWQHLAESFHKRFCCSAAFMQKRPTSLLTASIRNEIGLYVSSGQKKGFNDLSVPLILLGIYIILFMSSAKSVERTSLLKKWNPQILYLLSSANLVTGIAFDSSCKRKS